MLEDYQFFTSTEKFTSCRQKFVNTHMGFYIFFNVNTVVFKRNARGKLRMVLYLTVNIVQLPPIKRVAN